MDFFSKSNQIVYKNRSTPLFLFLRETFHISGTTLTTSRQIYQNIKAEKFSTIKKNEQKNKQMKYSFFIWIFF